jgi:hypothetical protein
MNFILYELNSTFTFLFLFFLLLLYLFNEYFFNVEIVNTNCRARNIVLLKLVTQINSFYLFRLSTKTSMLTSYVSVLLRVGYFLLIKERIYKLFQHVF